MQAYFMSSARRDDSNGEAQTTDDRNQRGKYAALREDFTPPGQSEPRMSDRGIKGISGESVVCMAWFRLHAAGGRRHLSYFDNFKAAYNELAPMSCPGAA